jgi:hypothetical protein
MSDNLKTGLNVPSFIFTDGGLPEAVVFNTIFQAVRQGFTDAKNLFGPLIKTPGIVENKSYVVSSDTYNSKMSGILETKKALFRTTANEVITNSFNLARIIGPHGSLNPIYLPGTLHSNTDQGAGWPLLSNTLEQQLPFPPTGSGGTYVMVGGSWTRQLTLAPIYNLSGNQYYVDEFTGTLYSNNFFTNSESLKYDLRIPNNESYLGAGYNVIPDLSINSLALGVREGLTGVAGDFGGVKIEFVESSPSNNTSRWKIQLPKVISARESLLSYGDSTNSRKIAYAGFEPVGRYHAPTESKRYCLREVYAGDLIANQLYSGEFLDENLAYLYDSKQQVSYDVALERSPGSSNWHIFYFNLPYAAVNVLTDHNDNLLASNSGTYNTQDFYLFLIQTNLSESITQLGANFSRHTHDGANSKKISHKNLSGNDAEMPVPKDYQGETGGLDVINFSRRFMRALAGTGIPSNDVHPQYFNRLGYTFGGTSGLYRKGITAPRELNMMHGDLVFSPIASVPKSYTYTTEEQAYSETERVTWNLTTPPSSSLRGHALIFGTPKQSTTTNFYTYKGVDTFNTIGSGEGLKIDVTVFTNTAPRPYETALVSITVGSEGSGYQQYDEFKILGAALGGINVLNDLTCRIAEVDSGGVTELGIPSGVQAFHHLSNFVNDTGATKIYYESNIFTADSGYDKTGVSYSLRRHGFVPGNLTNTTTSYSKGMNIGWGNLFFGYREDIFNGRLKVGTSEASAYWRTSEFNIVTTGNRNAGKNTNSAIKENYSYRDGFAVRGLAGGNVWLSVGGDVAEAPTPVEAGSTAGKPGVIALEASTYPTYTTNQPFGLKTEDWSKDVFGSGAGMFAAPSLTSSGRVPWSLDATVYTFPDKSPYLYANLWNNDIINSNADLKEGGLLDIFALAPDHNRFALDGSASVITSLEDIAIGTDKSLTGWIQGRPFIRGTYGINFCLNGSLTNLSNSFKTGFHRRQEEDDWGKGSPTLIETANEYLHREFRFWGKNSDMSPSKSSDSLENTVGGNLNLLYNFGRDYDRFGKFAAWSDSNLHGSGIVSSAWVASRSVALGSSKPEDYGSAIRQASFVEAFAGVRNDPFQPFTAEYVIPFEAFYVLAENADAYVEAGVSVAEILDTGTFVIADNIIVGGNPSYVNIEWDGIHNYRSAPISYTYNQVSHSLDGLIRGSEEIFLDRSGKQPRANIPNCLIDFKVNLQHFIGKKITGSVGTGDTDSPSLGTDHNMDYLKVIDLKTHEMVPAMKANYAGITDEDTNVIPVIFASGNGQSRFPVKAQSKGSLYILNAGESEPDGSGVVSETRIEGQTGSGVFVPPNLTGYDTALGVVPNLLSITEYRNKFPLFEEVHGSYMSNKQFCMLLNIQAKRYISDKNLPVPFQICREPVLDGKIYIRFVGWITMKVLTAEAY